MAQTVVGLFENQVDAQSAVRKIDGLEIPQAHVDLSRGDHEAFRGASDNDDDNAVTRFFKSLFGNDDEAWRYSAVGRQGYYIVSVHGLNDAQAEQVRALLDSSGAVDVDERAAKYGIAARRDGDIADTNTDKTINRIEEKLEVGKRMEERGGVRVRSRIVSRDVEEHVRLREEHVNVHRQPVDRPATERDFANAKDQTIELTERAEVPVVNKEARVVEEIHLSKEVTERDKIIKEKLRKNEVDIDKLDADERRGDVDRTNRV